MFLHLILLLLLPCLTYQKALPDLPSLSSPTPLPTSQSPVSAPKPTAPVSTQPATSVNCRDNVEPNPKLGKSQARYAVSVLLSTAAVGIASVLYSGVSSWNVEKRFAGWRFVAVVFARLSITAAVKVSAALVASITKADPEDGALDASGAFLTWGTAIFTQMYYEGFRMNMLALGYLDPKKRWLGSLIEFFNQRDMVKDNVEHDKDPTADHIREGVSDDKRGRRKSSPLNLSIWRNHFGGRWERKLFILTAAVFFAAELAVLISNVLSLVESFEIEETVFTSDEAKRPCAFKASDVAVLFGAILLQCVYALTNQPSLVPLLAISASYPEHHFKSKYKALDRLRWFEFCILFVWVASLLAMPLLEQPMSPYFIAGDISLFWFVITAPPSHTSVSYIITAAYTCLAAVVGAVLIYRVARDQPTEEVDNSNQ